MVSGQQQLHGSCHTGEPTKVTLMMRKHHFPSVDTSPAPQIHAVSAAAAVEICTLSCGQYPWLLKGLTQDAAGTLAQPERILSPKSSSILAMSQPSPVASGQLMRISRTLSSPSVTRLKSICDMFKTSTENCAN